MNHDFHIGDKVVYPNHGVGVVEQISSRMIGSMMQRYYELHIKASNLRVTVPFNNVEAVGLRRLIRTNDITQILEVLTDGKCESHQDWKFRFKENSEKMRTGSLLDVAFVLKSLLVLNQTKALSFRERKMLDRARYLLVSEMAMAKEVAEPEVEMLLTRALSKAKLKFPEVTADA
jgi:CarD family transcriptional regulator